MLTIYFGILISRCCILQKRRCKSMGLKRNYCSIQDLDVLKQKKIDITLSFHLGGTGRKWPSSVKIVSKAIRLSPPLPLNTSLHCFNLLQLAASVHNLLALSFQVCSSIPSCSSLIFIFFPIPSLMPISALNFIVSMSFSTLMLHTL